MTSHCLFESDIANHNTWNDLLNFLTHFDFGDKLQENLEDEGTPLSLRDRLVVLRARALTSGVLFSHYWMIPDSGVGVVSVHAYSQALSGRLKRHLKKTTCSSVRLVIRWKICHTLPYYTHIHVVALG